MTGLEICQTIAETRTIPLGPLELCSLRGQAVRDVFQSLSMRFHADVRVVQEVVHRATRRVRFLSDASHLAVQRAQVLSQAIQRLGCPITL